ncbi:MAG: FAD:protein FMN transferase [Nitrospirota bacterium]|jgi:thiamine biosynthesis lipoprotein
MRAVWEGRCRWLGPLLFAFVLLAIAGGCREGAPAVHSVSAIHMDTVVDVTVVGGDRTRAESLAEEVFAVFARIEAEMSRYRPTSTVSEINDRAGGPEWTSISPALEVVLREGLRIAALSDGAFSPTLAEVNRLWAFDSGGHTPDPAALEAAVSRADWHGLQLREHQARLANPGSGIDLGGIAKGYAVDEAADLLIARGVTGAIVNAGGDMRLIGHRPDGGPWRIGVQHPRDPDGVLEVIRATDCAVVSSGDYERYFLVDGVRYHHIIVPETGRPARGCQGVTVVADRAMTADGLATAAFVLGPEAGLELLRRAGAQAATVVDYAGRIHHLDGSLGSPHPDAGRPMPTGDTP